ncbi:DUF2325 domain-containing protein [Helicobacter burdigaliensis]|uniref:DUF2325 domain-containing protein n=1 Tax=Helicobacter burdigaliensis TaxID=2315334 RepID=UPI000EF6BD19|nr:DUF2325 domain-containing protein [Helicobacter burdigaliensis]
MSVLVIGGDEITPIRAVLKNLGCSKITHWDGRRESVNHKDIPQNTSCLVMLTNFLNHNTMRKFRNEAKKKEIPIICTKRSASCLYCEFSKMFCKECECK